MNEQNIYIEKKYINSDISTDLAVKALLYEVTISPKAGLVTRISNGSHKDMNFYTFLDSAVSLRNYFSDCYKHSEKYSFNEKIFFKELRELGKIAEKDMLKATKGINTHKGTIFSMGILIATISSKLKEAEKINLGDLVVYIENMCSPLKEELGIILDNTNGEKIYNKYKIKGARGLALSGYSVVLKDGIKKILQFTKKIDFETSCILLLFYYMSVLDDTNIISRSNIEVLEKVKKESAEIFNRHIIDFNRELIRKDMSELNKNFVEKNISPGGSADLLILTIFIYFLINKN